MKNTIFDIENWREISATLAQNKTRTFMTGFGIFWGTAILAMLMGGAQGLQLFMARNFEGFATNCAIVFPGRTTMSYGGFNKGMPVELNLTDVANFRRAIPEMESSSPINNMWAQALYGQNSSQAMITGVEADYSKIFVPKMYEGRFINEADCAGIRKVCVIGKKVADELFKGGESPLGKDVALNGIYYKVVGVAGQTSEINMGAELDESVVIPLSSMGAAYNLGDQVQWFMFTLKQGYKPASCEKTIRRLVSRNHPVDPTDEGAIFYFDVSEKFEMLDNIFLGISLLAFIVGLGTLLSGIIGVGNIMWIIVRERTHEIGIRRAIGAKPRDIIVQILSESMVLTTVAGVAGITFATLVLFLAETLSTEPDGSYIGFQLSFGEALGILATFLVLGTAAGIIPAVKAMRIKPIEALNEK